MQTMLIVIARINHFSSKRWEIQTIRN